MITKAIALTLRYGAILHHASLTNSDKTPRRCIVIGKCLTWVTRPNEFKLLVKARLYEYGYITETNGINWSVVY